MACQHNKTNTEKKSAITEANDRVILRSIHDEFEYKKSILKPILDENAFDDLTWKGWSFTQGEFDELSLRMAKISCVNGSAQYSGPDVTSNKELTAGITYLGQLIAHDIVKDSNIAMECDGLTKYRRPEATFPLNLDSIFWNDGDLNDLVNSGVICEKFKFKLCKIDTGHKSKSDVSLFTDFFRRRDQKGNDWIASIPELRNDENVIVSQVSILFMRIHNAAIDLQENQKALDALTKYKFAKNFTLLIFQWLSIELFLKPLLPDVIKNCIASGERFWADETEPLKPVFTETPMEFSHAFFRLGHSMVRRGYKVGGNGQKGIKELMRRNQKLTNDFVIRFDRFFYLHSLNSDNNSILQFASGLDSQITHGLLRSQGLIASNNATERKRGIEWLNNFIYANVLKDKKNVITVSDALDVGIESQRHAELLSASKDVVDRFSEHVIVSESIACGLEHRPSPHIGRQNLIFLDLCASTTLPSATAYIDSLEKLSITEGQTEKKAWLKSVKDELEDLNFKVSDLWNDSNTPRVNSIQDKEIRFDSMPLWLFSLRESEIRCEGKTLGPLTGSIVADVICDSIRACNDVNILAVKKMMVDNPNESQFRKKLSQWVGDDLLVNCLFEWMKKYESSDNDLRKGHLMHDIFEFIKPKNP